MFTNFFKQDECIYIMPRSIKMLNRDTERSAINASFIKYKNKPHHNITKSKKINTEILKIPKGKTFIVWQNQKL